MKTSCFWSSLSMVALVMLAASSARAGMVLFDFNQSCELDGAYAGVTMTRDDGNVANAITLSSLAVEAPDYNASQLWDGVTYIASRTNVGSGLNQLSINNNDSSSEIPFGSGETNGWDAGEYWTFKFDKAVVFDNFNFTSFGNEGDESLIVTINSLSYTKTITDGDVDSNEDIDDPFDGLEIPAGTEIRFTGGGDPNDPGDTSHWRLDTFTVTEVPEPTSVVLLLLSGLATAFIRIKS